MNEIDKKIAELDKELRDKRQEMVSLIKQREEIKIRDYELPNHQGDLVKLSSLFTNGNELILVHNMGQNCRWCNFWAHGLNGIYSYLIDRTNFVLLSPDPPEIQKEVKIKRRYQFMMLSGHGSNIIEDLGFATRGEKDISYMPGFSILEKRGDNIYRTQYDYYGPHDHYNIGYHHFDLLNANEDWSPKME